MKLSCDASGLEWNVAAYLSQDKVAIQEIIDGFDLHEDNRKRFELPERRLAKIFLFRLIYGGTAWAYANDSAFNFVSRDPDFWQRIIDGIYDKYRGLKSWHDKLESGVKATGIYESPTGRIYHYRTYRNKRGEYVWPRTTILNYPVQGLGADIVMLARIAVGDIMKQKKYKSLLVNTIHDSIEIDTTPDEWYNINVDCKNVFEELPENFEKNFGVPYNIPLRCELTLNGEKVK